MDLGSVVHVVDSFEGCSVELLSDLLHQIPNSLLSRVLNGVHVFLYGRQRVLLDESCN